MKTGWTPLHEAAIRGHRSVSALLLEWGANPNLALMYGKKVTAMDMAKGNGGYSAADWNIGFPGTLSAVEKSGAGSIPAAARSIGLAVAVAVAAAGTMTEESSARSTQNRVLDNRDLCRIISSFVPERNYL
eukprot:gene24011-31179_t